MRKHALAAFPSWPDEKSDEINHVKWFLVQHRLEFLKELNRIESGNLNIHNELDTALSVTLMVIGQESDATAEIHTSTEILTFAIASNTKCTRTAYANNANTQFTSASKQLKAILLEYSKCLYTSVGETREYSSAQNVLKYMEPRMEKIDRDLQEFITVSVGK